MSTKLKLPKLKGKPKYKMIVTHKAVDLDAILGVWFLKRYGGLDDASIEFVNTGNPDPELLAKADAVVDTGGVFDPDNLRFDHHQLQGDESTSTCAAPQIWEYLVKKYAMKSAILCSVDDLKVDDMEGPVSRIEKVQQGDAISPLDHLLPLVLLVYAGDNALKIHGVDYSQDVGLHALLSGFKEGNKRLATDGDIFDWMCYLLDTIDIHLESLTKAKAELDEKMVYQSNDGKVVALKHASTAASFAAYEVLGANLVVFEGEPIVDADGDVISYPLGISRKPEATEPHIGELVTSIIDIPNIASKPMQLVQDELKLFYNHNGGFFSGKGTAKAPFPHPPLCDLAELAEWIDHLWER